jgi:hypothetical protein
MELKRILESKMGCGLDNLVRDMDQLRCLVNRIVNVRTP